MCTACPIGFYSDIVGSASCSICPAGRTTALTASTSVETCQSPTTSFGLGLVGIFIAVVLITVNILASSFQITAFVRRTRIVDPIASTCKKLMVHLDTIKRAMFKHKLNDTKEGDATVLQLSNHFRTLRNMIKLLIIMISMSFMTMITMMLFFGQYIVRMFYHTFVLWRGLRFDFELNSDFAAIMNSVLIEIALVINVPYISSLLLVFFPMTALFVALSSFHLNLNSVNVNHEHT